MYMTSHFSIQVWVQVIILILETTGLKVFVEAGKKAITTCTARITDYSTQIYEGRDIGPPQGRKLTLHTGIYVTVLKSKVERH